MVCVPTHAHQDFSAAIELEENIIYEHAGRFSGLFVLCFKNA